MGRVNDTFANVNAAVRNFLLLTIVGGMGFGGYKGYELLYSQPQKQLAEKNAELKKTAESLQKANDELTARQKEVADLSGKLKDKIVELEKTEVAMKLLKVQHRLARLTVLDQREIPSLNPAVPITGTQVAPSRANVRTKVSFVEINEEGQPIGEAKQFDIEGDMIYVDYLTVSFEDKFIEQNDLDRSTSIALFQRLFGEHQEPVNGFQLDTVGTRPSAYARGTEASDFEKKIWNDFWLIANDRQKAKEMGIDAIQGKAVSIRAQPGKTYEIELRATGDMTIRPVEVKAPPAAEAKNGR